ncbi:MAG: MOSC domain-containing protein [Pyrinomonadaceae bacterium]
MQGHVHQLNCSAGGVPKLPVDEAELTPTGLVGDRQAKPFIHGGPQRALSLYSLELIEELRAEGHPISPGAAGENVTVAGLDWSRLSPGARLRIGDEVVIEISGYANPCPTIRHSFTNGEFKRISQKLTPGVSRLYARVLSTGRIRVGDPVVVLDATTTDARSDEISVAAKGAKARRVMVTLASLGGRKNPGAV